MSQIQITHPDGVLLSLAPEQFKIELDNDSLTIRAAGRTIFAGHELPLDVHGAYAEWAEWADCRFVTSHDRQQFNLTIQNLVEAFFVDCSQNETYDEFDANTRNTFNTEARR